jgi:hypothetical protein
MHLLSNKRYVVSERGAGSGDGGGGDGGGIGSGNGGGNGDGNGVGNGSGSGGDGSGAAALHARLAPLVKFVAVDDDVALAAAVAEALTDEAKRLDFATKATAAWRREHSLGRWFECMHL